MDISNSQSSGSSCSWGQLNAEDVRQVDFTIKVPSDAHIGNQYNITIAVSSYGTPAGPFGIRSPLDYPDATSSKSFVIQVAPVASSQSTIDFTPIVTAAASIIIVLVIALLIVRWYLNR